MLDTTPLAMTDSFPATERTPLLNCIMSGTAGRTLLKLYEPPDAAETHKTSPLRVLHALLGDVTFKSNALLY